MMRHLPLLTLVSSHPNWQYQTPAMHSLHRTLALAALHVTSTLSSPIETAAQVVPPEYPYGNTLQQGQSLLVGQGLISPNGQYTLVLQDDGNLVEYYYADFATWATETAGLTIDHATLQLDGNFVLYDHMERAARASETGTYWQAEWSWGLGYRLVLQDDEYVTVEETRGLKSMCRPLYSVGWVAPMSSEPRTGLPSE